MSLRPLNREPQYMSGDYAKMFNIPVHQSNQGFAMNPYRPGTSRPEQCVCFSLINGNVPCGQYDPNNINVWRTTGELAKLPLTRTC